MEEQKQIQKKIYVFVFINLRGKFILCYFAYAYVASENHAGFKPGFHISQFIGDLLSGIAEGENDFRNTKDFIHR